MCDPASLALIVGSTLASSAIQGQAADKVSGARNSAITAEQADLAKYRKTATQALGQSQDAASRPTLDAATQAAQDQREQDYSSVLKPEDLLPGQGDASQAVRQSIVNSLGTGTAKAKQDASNKAIVDGYGDATFGRDVNMNRAGQAINTQGNFAAGRANVLPIELDAANHAGDRLQSMAGLVQGLGTAAAIGYGKIPGAGAIKESAASGLNNLGFGNTAYDWLSSGDAAGMAKSAAKISPTSWTFTG